jgi:hypothetical protein
MNPDGSIRPNAKQPTMEKEELLKFYKLMVLLNVRATSQPPVLLGSRCRCPQ